MKATSLISHALHKLFPFPYHSQTGNKVLGKWTPLLKVSQIVFERKQSEWYSSKSSKYSTRNLQVHWMGQCQTLQMCANCIWILWERVGSFISHLSSSESKRTQIKFTASTAPNSSTHLTNSNIPTYVPSFARISTKEERWLCEKEEKSDIWRLLQKWTTFCSAENRQIYSTSKQ